MDIKKLLSIIYNYIDVIGGGYGLNGKFNKDNILNFKDNASPNKKRILKTVVILLVSIILIYAFKEEIKGINFPETLKVLRSLENITIIIILALGMISISFITLYDFTMNRFLSLGLSFMKVFKIGWVSNSINNFVGLGGLVGASLRTFLYEKEGIDRKAAIRSNVYIVLSNITGLSLLIILGFLKLYDFSFLLMNNKWYYIILLGFSLYLPLFFLIDKIKILKKKLFKDQESVSIRFKIMMVVSSTLDWLAATLYFSGIILFFSKGLPMRGIIPVYLISISLGIISFLPSGLGSFDISAFAGLKLLGATSESALAGILIYRLFYYVIPWMFSMLIFVSELRIGKDKTKRQNSKLANEYSTKALSALVFFAGVVLILSAAMPALVERIKILKNFTSIPILQFSKRSSVAIGIMLLILSKGIYDKVRSAYKSTIVLLILGALLTFIKGLDFEEATILIIISLLLLSSKDNFYRETAPVKVKNIILMFIITAIMSIIYGVIAYVFHGDFKYILIKGKKHIFIETSIIFLTVWILMALFLIIRVKRFKFIYPDEEEIKELEKFLETNKGNIMTHLLFLKDKCFYYTKDRQLLIPFATIRDKLVVLGEPIGNQKFLEEGIGEFRKFADRYAMIPVFYEISDKNFSLYHDFGYEFLKLGEEAIINLDEFNLSGKKKKALRLAKNKVENGELEFKIINPPFDDDLFDELKKVSDEWLGSREERGFSLGWFTKDYLNRSPIAIVSQDNHIIAFANLMPLYDGETMSIDLMRSKNEIPNGTMDALFIELMEWSKAQGYTKFNLGMAPLSNVGVNPYSAKLEKLIKNLYRHGNKLYSFNGLRKYKEKFQPEWESRYLAYPRGSNISILLLQIVMLTSKHKK